MAAFVISNIEDVLEHFDNRMYYRIVTETLSVIQKGTPLSTQYFLSHSVKEIRELSASILSTPYEYSDNWIAKFNRPLETQETPIKNFLKDSEQALKRFKLRKIIKLCDQNQDIIRKSSDSGDMSTMMKHLKIQQKLLEMRNSLATELNTVILK